MPNAVSFSSAAAENYLSLYLHLLVLRPYINATGADVYVLKCKPEECFPFFHEILTSASQETHVTIPDDFLAFQKFNTNVLMASNVFL